MISRPGEKSLTDRQAPDILSGMSEVFPLFGRDFIFGAASAAYQIEGAWNLDGKGPSIWDTFAHRGGKIKTGETADTACDHYHRFAADIAIMKQLGLDAYRGSIAWTRIIPDGTGDVNQPGIDFYSRLTDALLEAGIAPWYTLFHWDLPSALQKRLGGFRNRDIAEIFGDYVDVVVRALGDRVRNWITINEPFEFAFFGHVLGSWAPGIKNPLAYFPVMHNILRAHGAAVRRIRALSPGSSVGITLSLTPVVPASDTEKDRRATEVADAFLNHIDLSPILKGCYPRILEEHARILLPKVLPGDMECISQPLDFIGINYYTRERANHAWYIPFLHAWVSGKDAAPGEFERAGVQYTAMGWEVYPEGLYTLAMMLKHEYGNPPVVITENGAAFEDLLSGNEVHDPKRTSYLRSYLEALSRAIDDGADVRGYFVWSLLDNFEWAEGTRPRFGIVYVDYPSQRRIIKDSGHWYARLIKVSKGPG